jgi:hypothetical protein
MRNFTISGNFQNDSVVKLADTTQQAMDDQNSND